MIVISIGDIIIWTIAGIALIVLGFLGIVDKILAIKEKKLQEKLKEFDDKKE